jgi:hypothetical protein
VKSEIVTFRFDILDGWVDGLIEKGNTLIQLTWLGETIGL